VLYRVIPQILKQEGSSFYDVSRRWQPKDLIPDPYRRNLLKDALARYKLLAKAEDELQTLIRAPLYIGILKQMRLDLKTAQFAWRMDDLKFINAISKFLKDYGTVMRHLQLDKQRGSFANQPE